MSAIAKEISDVLEVGDVMPEGHDHAGWIYGGISKTTSKPFYIAPRDSGVMHWWAAKKFAVRSKARVPSWRELNQLYEARNEGALKDTFNTTGSIYDGWYWSSSSWPHLFHAWQQLFSDGVQEECNKERNARLRCVRG
jgi:hypothetical protein